MGLHSYATLAQLRLRQDQLNSSKTGMDPTYLKKLRAATDEINDKVNRFFYPVVATHQFDWQSSIKLEFRSQDLLSLTTLVDGAGVSIPLSSVIYLGGADITTGPYYGVELDPTKSYFLYLVTKTRCISVTGVWGWHDDYANAWIDSTLTVSGNINSSVAVITLSGDPTTTADAWGNLPAISAGNLIQIDTGSSLEWCWVVATTSTTMTVVRGQNGTTAAAHSGGATIKVYQPPSAINDICLRWAAWLVAQDNTDFGKVALDVFGRPIVRAGVPTDILDALAQYENVRVT